MSIGKIHWWIGKDGERLGPFSLATLRNLIIDGKLSASDLVWRNGFDGWKQASGVTELSLPPPLSDDKTKSTDQRLIDSGPV